MSRPDKCCWNCVHARFKKDAAGRRQALYGGQCMIPLPDLPQIVLDRYPPGTSDKERIDKWRTIYDTTGQRCACFWRDNGRLHDEVLCPVCHGLSARQQSQIGVLRDSVRGQADVHRCRHCGAVFNHYVESGGDNGRP